VDVATTVQHPPPTARRPAPRRRPRRGGIRHGERLSGWLFVSPAVLLIVVFLAVPVLMALWVSLTSWGGIGSPFSSDVPWAGTKNYVNLFAQDGLLRQDFMTSIRNIFYYTILVVPAQTALALFLALLLNSKVLKAKGFFRSAFYFPSVTSSVAITTVFIFLFSGGAINAVLGWFGIDGPQWLTDPRGLVHVVLGWLHVVDPSNPPSILADHGVLSLSWWDWISGPSVAMSALIVLVVWTTTGTFMLMYLAALQDVPVEMEEASLLDGASTWQRLRYVVIPVLKPTTFLVITLGLIGSWQVFDQVFIATQGGPDKTTLSPAYLSYAYGFADKSWGPAAAMAFVLFAIIIVFTLLQRYVMRDRDAIAERKAVRRAARAGRRTGSGSTSSTVVP
jgi:multiple sugar transport system permease protein